MKSGWNRALLAALALVAGGWTSATTPAPPAESPRDALMRTDSEFSKLSLEKGAEQAFAAYIAPDGILLTEYPAKHGGEAVRAQFFAAPAGMILTWKPLSAEIASSGDLGYTVGTYELKTPGSSAATRTGKYVTIWKKQPDGSWKFVLDAGNPNPPLSSSSALKP